MKRALTLIRYFPQVPPHLDYALPFAEEAVTGVLEQRQVYLPLLQELNFRVLNEASIQLKTRVRDSDLEMSLRDLRVKAYKPRKLLSNTFAPIESSHGMTERVYLMGNVSRENFIKEVLAQARVIKDPSIGEEHGEYTHRIQLVLLMMACDQGIIQLPKNVKFADFIKAMAYFSQLADDGFHGRFSGRGLWDYTVDRNPFGKDNTNSPFNTKSLEEISSPENLTKMIKKDKLLIPSIALLLELREEKRVAQGLRDPRVWIKYEAGREYFTKKKFGKSFKECTKQEQQEALLSQGEDGAVFIAYGERVELAKY